MTILAKNQVLVWRGLPDPLDLGPNRNLIRLLDYDSSAEEWYYIPIPVEKDFPRSMKRERLEALLGDGLQETDDPFSLRLTNIGEGSPAAKERDRRMRILQPIVGDRGLLHSSTRGPLLRALAEDVGSTSETIRKWLRRWWERGQVPGAVAPDYGLRGGLGIRKTAGEAKRGRKRCYSDGSAVPEGINVTPKMAELLAAGGREYYENPQRREKGKKATLKRAYERTLQAYFREVRYTTHGEELVLSEAIPSYEQFRYWYKKDRKARGLKATKNAMGARKYNLEARPLKGGSTLEQIGPGMRLEVDSQVTDLFLVSPFDPSFVIGRAILYLIVDSYSRLICGYTITLENPSWTGMKMLLRSAFTPKIAQAARYGIEISEQDWPYRHLPTEVVGDRFELISQHSRYLSDELQVQVSALPAYRADWKPIVERAFAYVNTNVVHELPGGAGIRKRGEQDPRRYALLTPGDLNQVMLHHILFNNRSRRLSDLKTMPKEYPVERLGPPTPLELFNFGLDNIVGTMRTADPVRIRQALDRRGEASVSRNGVRFDGRLYWPAVNPMPVPMQRWFDRSRKKSVPDVSVLSDNRDVTEILLLGDWGAPIPARLHRGYERYAGLAGDQAEALLREFRKKVAETEHGSLMSKMELLDTIDSIHLAASTRARDRGRANSKEVRSARAKARQLERLLDPWTGAPETEDPVHPADDNEDGAGEDSLEADENTARPDYMDVIRRES